MNTVSETDGNELVNVEKLDEVRQAAPTALANAPLRRGLLICVAVLLLTLAYAVRNSINEIEAQNQMIYDYMKSPVFVSTK